MKEVNTDKVKSFRISEGKWEEFKMVCILNETTMSEVLLDMINTYIVTNKAEALEKLCKMKWV